MDQALKTADKTQLPSGAANKVRKWLHMLEAVYGNQPITPDGILAWTRLLCKCDERIMDDVVMDWLRNEERHPKPAQLLSKYEAAMDAQRKKTFEKKYDENGNSLYKCPFCRDTKFIIAEVRGSYGTVAYPCGCNRQGGNLAKALEDPAYEFDWDYGVFRLVNRWIGDTRWVG